MVKRINVTYHLAGVTDDQREAAERAHRFHADNCPIARSIGGSIDISTALEYV